MKTSIIFLLAGLTGLFGPVPNRRPVTVSDANFVGAVPRLTTDPAGNPLLSWVEKTGDQEASFYFARSTGDDVEPSSQGPSSPAQLFGEKIRVKAPANLSTHAEGMPKIAVKTDGTLLAVFEVPRPTTASRFAGELLYTLSTDGGKTWTEPKPVHRNTAPGTSHSYSDVARLPNGEIGVVWLDEKGPGQEGRPVKFVQTLPGGGFGPEVLVDENACQCCRTNLFVDTEKRIHLTYRDLVPGGEGKIAARDVSTAVSTDGGKTFSRPVAVYADNWRVNACPHAGPSAAQLGNDIFVTWFSGKENAVGLRLARLGSDELVATVLSNRAKHPQVTTVGGRLVWVWDEAIPTDGSGAMGSFVQRIGLRTLSGSKPGPTTYLTPETVSAAYPSVLATKNGLLVAYEQVTGNQKVVIAVQLNSDL